MYTLKDKNVKIKKPRACWGCGIIMPTGRIMRYNVSILEGNFGTSYWCEVCDAYLRESNEDFSDGIAQYEFKGEFNYRLFKKDYLCQERKVIFEKILKTHNNLSYDIYHEFYTR
jgi:hypothetical protein